MCICVRALASQKRESVLTQACGVHKIRSARLFMFVLRLQQLLVSERAAAEKERTLHTGTIAVLEGQVCVTVVVLFSAPPPPSLQIIHLVWSGSSLACAEILTFATIVFAADAICGRFSDGGGACSCFGITEKYNVGGIDVLQAVGGGGS